MIFLPLSEPALFWNVVSVRVRARTRPCLLALLFFLGASFAIHDRCCWSSRRTTTRKFTVVAFAETLNERNDETKRKKKKRKFDAQVSHGNNNDGVFLYNSRGTTRIGPETYFEIVKQNERKIWKVHKATDLHYFFFVCGKRRNVHRFLWRGNVPLYVKYTACHVMAVSCRVRRERGSHEKR